ncbi:hypothetical protein LWI29_013571 [Acer saccharum]|uniref:Glycosyltransferase n=1 Tax=Acer saccharum TaxID=4024 RepID=A0AA39TKB2_ACESA|nr:hypothetical protein LWI29_013571 [Acer saccharum]
MLKPQILLVTYPAQGHINPGLQLAKRLVSIGVQVTFVTTVYAIRRMNKISVPEGLTFGSFSDGYDDGFKPGDGDDIYWAELRRVGSQTLAEFLVASTEQGKHYSCIVYSILLPWIEKVAAAANIPTTLFWNQTATMLDVYYYYSNGYGDVIKNNINDPSFSLKLRGLPELNSRDFPSFFVSSNPYPFALPLFQEQIEILDQQSHPRVLVNTFDALESEALKAINHKYNVVGIGPLIPSAFLDGKDPSDKCFGGDIVKNSSSSSSRDSYMEWLDSKPESSVIYVSFGSMSVLSKPQMEEMARGLLGTGRPFLWVIREKEEEEEELSCIKELEEQGKIVRWCSQVEVLSHKSLGCFMTHCGWNSTFESLCSGVPMVAFPQWTDQTTNAKLVEDVWKIGVRVNFNEDKEIVDGDEIYRCLELVMGCKEMASNAKKWMELAREAAKEAGGSSHKNLKDFVDQISHV